MSLVEDFLKMYSHINGRWNSYHYEGQEQHYAGGNDPSNREAIWLSGYSTTSTLYRHIASVNQVRNQAIYKQSSYPTYKNMPIYKDSSVLAMRKGMTAIKLSRSSIIKVVVAEATCSPWAIQDLRAGL